MKINESIQKISLKPHRIIIAGDGYVYEEVPAARCTEVHGMICCDMEQCLNNKFRVRLLVICP